VRRFEEPARFVHRPRAPTPERLAGFQQGHQLGHVPRYQFLASGMVEHGPERVPSALDDATARKVLAALADAAALGLAPRGVLALGAALAGACPGES